MDAFIDWILGTGLSEIMRSYRWAWPIAETLHFTGLVVFAGVVGVFDLRLLGLGTGISVGKLHRLIRLAVVAFGLLALTGIAFISGAPDQYFFNAAFYVKVAGLTIMAGNLVVFYSIYYSQVTKLAPDMAAPLGARIVAVISLGSIVTVMCAGRMLTFFRPGGFY